MVYASHVPQSVYPARENLLTVLAVRQSTCCKTTLAYLIVQQAIMPKGQNAIIAQLNAKNAIKMACVLVSVLCGAVRSRELVDLGKRIKEKCFER